MTASSLRSLLAGLALAVLLASAVAAQTQLQTQSLPIPKPGWYFLSLQVEPTDPDPLAVFPAIGGFAYDHLWSFDAQLGWQHFSPAFALDPGLQSFNDLSEIVALRGYWIRVTRVPTSSFELMVSGDPVSILQLTGAGWHAIGPLLPPDAASTNLQGVFSDLGPSLPQAVPEAWGYDALRDEFVSLSPATADCAATPSRCLTPGSGYWILTTGDLALGQEFRITPPQVLISADAPLQKLVISYTGVGAAAGALRASTPGTSVVFNGASFAFIDGFSVAEPDPTAASADGPDTQADLDGDGSVEPCPDRCGGASDCVNLCFSNPTRQHTVYVGLDRDALYAMESFTSLQPGFEFATLELDLGAPPQAALPASGTTGSEIVARVPLAVKPPILVGEYVGYLYYGGDVQGQVPVRVLMDDCIQTPGGGPASRDCSTARLTAVMNPTIIGSSSNGLDDDDDGDVDEADEEGGEFRTGGSPAFPGDVVLHGSAVGGNQLLRLEGTAPAGGALKHVRPVACTAGQCADGSGACSVDDECPRNAGVGRFFGQSTRFIQLEGRRIGAETFSGSFVDRYESSDLDAGGNVAGSGLFTLQNISSPQCVLRDPGSLRSKLLDVPCRGDADCPRRCIGGHPSLDGFSCADDSDCVATLNGGAQVTSTCQPFLCRFTALGGPSAEALAHAPLVLTLTTADTFDVASVELLGSDRIAVVRPADLASVDLGLLPCGPQTVRISASNCAPVVVTLPDACAPGPPIAFSCSGPPDTPTAGPPEVSGGAFSVVGGVSTTGPTTFQLDDPSASCASCIARWEESDGTPVATLLVDGPQTLQLFGLGASDVSAGRNGADPWTDLASWPPVEGVLSGLFHHLPELPGAGSGF